MISKTTNPPSVTEAIVTPESMLRHVIIAGKATRTAALELCYSAAAFILLVNHFLDSDAKGFMTKTDAIDYLQAQIAEQAGVKGGMLNLYIRNAGTLCSILTGSVKMFSPTIKLLAEAKEPPDMVAILSAWMDENNGKRVESMNSLSDALGFKTSRATGSNAVKAKDMNTEQATTKAVNAVTAVGQAVASGNVKESSVAKAIIANVKSALVYAREAIKAITETDDLDALEATIKEQREALKSLTATANAKVAERTEQYLQTKVRHRKHNATGRSARATA